MSVSSFHDEGKWDNFLFMIYPIQFMTYIDPQWRTLNIYVYTYISPLSSLAIAFNSLKGKWMLNEFDLFGKRQKNQLSSKIQSYGIIKFLRD